MFKAIANLFRRLFNIGRSNAHAALNAAEDPEKMLNMALDDMRSQFVKAKEQVASAIAHEKRLLREMTQRKTDAEAWEQKAMKALQAGDEELAKIAVERSGEAEAEYKELCIQHEKAKTGVEHVKQALSNLDKKIDEGERKKKILVARKKRADAQLIINETLNQISIDDHGTAFGRMEDKITQLEAQADASEELSALGPGAEMAAIEEKFKALDAGDTDKKLAALKEKLALPPAKEA